MLYIVVGIVLALYVHIASEGTLGLASPVVIGLFWPLCLIYAAIASSLSRRFVPLLALCLALTGCSAKAAIGKAAHEVSTRAASATGHIDAAIGTGEVGPKALPHLDDAKDDIAVIGEQAAVVTDALPGVKDVNNWWWLSWAIVLAPVTFLVWRFWPVVQIGIAWVVALFGGTPKATKARAEADAAWEADPTPVDATDVPTIKAMAVSEATDPAYRVAKARAKGGK